MNAPDTTPPNPPAPRIQGEWIAVASILAGSILYSGKGLFGKAILLHGISVTDLMALRTAWAAPFYLGVLVWALSHHRPSARDVLLLCGYGVAGFWIGPRLTFEGLRHTTAGLERILIQTAPAWIVLIVWVLHGKRPSAKTLGALALCYAGLLLACFGRDGMRATASPLGVVQILTGCLVWGWFVVHVGPLQTRCGVALTTSAGMLVGAVCSAIESAWNGTLGVVLAPGREVVAPIAGLVVLSTVIPSFLTQNGLHKLGPVRMGILSLAGPALVPFLAAAFLGERMSAPQVAGLAVVVAASVPLGFALRK